MTVEDFFDESTEQSQIKSEIVAKYFWSWAKVILTAVKKRGGDRIAYIDLFAGPGKYESGKISTPLKVLMRISQDSIFNQHVLTIFNDIDRKNCKLLENAIQELKGIEKLKYRPRVLNVEIGESFIKEIEQMATVPT
ncbi:MAG TPA: three-Cys-motif partner protein TcmP, partial [Acidobacteriota bacterium]|nr:three-Cys-motif partner protein TcmP [Acidobacteriota bacterium]